ncbi:MAG TPA: hypothetical protein DCO86_00360 [Spirochaetaceae bacterium]|nr:hypothetical protein [Spirochaetaceae bacterium]
MCILFHQNLSFVAAMPFQMQQAHGVIFESANRPRFKNLKPFARLATSTRLDWTCMSTNSVFPSDIAKFTPKFAKFQVFCSVLDCLESNTKQHLLKLLLKVMVILDWRISKP